ncbi:MAG: hypothetical protein AAF191_18110 [Verrucomicrobiota bacterium]
MSKFQGSLRIHVLLVLLTWTAACHHDLILELADIAHVHVSALHPHSHYHHHHDEIDGHHDRTTGGSQGDEHSGEPVHLPDCHSIPLAASPSSLRTPVAEEFPSDRFSDLGALPLSDRAAPPVASGRAPPWPPWTAHAVFASMLANCVQANAPPVLS